MPRGIVKLNALYVAFNSELETLIIQNLNRINESLVIM